MNRENLTRIIKEEVQKKLKESRADFKLRPQAALINFFAQKLAKANVSKDVSVLAEQIASIVIALPQLKEPIIKSLDSDPDGKLHNTSTEKKRREMEAYEQAEADWMRKFNSKEPGY